MPYGLHGNSQHSNSRWFSTFPSSVPAELFRPLNLPAFFITLNTQRCPFSTCPDPTIGIGAMHCGYSLIRNSVPDRVGDAHQPL